MRNYKQLSQAQRYLIEIFKESRKELERDSSVSGRIGIDDFRGIEAESGQARLLSETGAN